MCRLVLTLSRGGGSVPLPLGLTVRLGDFQVVPAEVEGKGLPPSPASQPLSWNSVSSVAVDTPTFSHGHGLL